MITFLILITYYLCVFAIVGIAHMVNPSVREYFVAGAILTHNRAANIAITVSLPVWLPVIAFALLCIYAVSVENGDERN